jgi:hypothetical protein
VRYNEARTGNGTGFVLSAFEQARQNTVYVLSIHVEHNQVQALQPAPPQAHVAASSRAEHNETWQELSNAGQFECQVNRKATRPCVRQASAHLSVMACKHQKMEKVSTNEHIPLGGHQQHTDTFA